MIDAGVRVFEIAGGRARTANTFAPWWNVTTRLSTPSSTAPTPTRKSPTGTNASPRCLTEDSGTATISVSDWANATLKIRFECHSCEGVCRQGHSLLLKTGRGRIPDGGRRTACGRRNRDYRSHNRRAAHDRGGNSCGFETSGNDQKRRTLLHQDRHKNPPKRQTFPLAKGGASTAIIMVQWKISGKELYQSPERFCMVGTRYFESAPNN